MEGAQLYPTDPLVLGRRRIEAGKVRLVFGKVAFFEVMVLMTAYFAGATYFISRAIWPAFNLDQAWTARAIGIVALLACILGLRRGLRGAVLHIDKTAMAYVLSAPVSWPDLLRPTLVAPFAAAIGGGLWIGTWLGTGLGLRLGGPPWRWALQASVGLAAISTVYVASELMAYANPPLRRIFSLLVGLTLVAALIDVLAGTSLSWTTALGQLTVGSASPATVVLAVAPPVALLAAAASGIYEIPVEKVINHNEVMSSFAFGASDESPRRIWLSYRRSAGESPRHSPLGRVPPALALRFPVSSRDLRGVLRSANQQLLRLATLAGLGVVAVAQVASGGWLFAIGAAAASYFIAAELLEGLAQEGDAPELAAQFPVSPRSMIVRHFAVPAVLMVGGWTLLCAPVLLLTGHGFSPATLLVGPVAGLGAVVAATFAMVRPERKVVQQSLSRSGGFEPAGGPGLSIIFGLLGRFVGPVIVAAIAYAPLVSISVRQSVSLTFLTLSGGLLLYAVLFARVSLFGRGPGPLRRIGLAMQRAARPLVGS